MSAALIARYNVMASNYSACLRVSLIAVRVDKPTAREHVCKHYPAHPCLRCQPSEKERIADLSR
jgi:hypothetical protein